MIVVNGIFLIWNIGSKFTDICECEEDCHPRGIQNTFAKLYINEFLHIVPVHLDIPSEDASQY